MDNESLTTTQTNSAKETQGRILGVELPLVRWIILILATGLAAFGWLQAKQGVGLTAAFWLIVVPVALAGVLLTFFTQNRHGSFPSDVAETILTGGNAAPPGTGGALFSRLFPHIPDGFFMNGLLVFNGLRPGGWVAKGLWLDIPDLQYASEPERNRFDMQVRRLMKLAPESWRLHVLWWADSDYQEELRGFDSQTAKFTEPACKAARERQARHFREEMRRGRLRRQRVVLLAGLPADGKSSSPWRTQAAARLYDAFLAQAAAQLAEFARQAHALLAPLGGGATPMSDLDHYKVILQTLNPSLARRFGFDAGAGFDPNRSILENCMHSPIRTKRGLGGFILDELHHRVLGLKHWPLTAFPNAAHAFTHPATGDHTIAVQIRRLPLEPLLAAAQRALDRVNQQLAAKPNERLMVTKATLEERIQRLSQGDRLPFMVEMIFVERAPTEELLSDRALARKSAVHSLQGAACVEGLPAFAKNAFLKLMPGNLFSRHRGHELFAEDGVLSAFVPFASTFVGDLDSPHAIYPGRHGNIIAIRVFAGTGPGAMPLNVLLLGAPGTGKSVVASNLILQIAGFFSFIFLVEEGQSHINTTRALGGVTIFFRLDGQQAINQFDTHGHVLTAEHLANIVAMLGHMVGLPADESQARSQQAFLAKRVEQFLRDFADDTLKHLPESRRRNLILQAKRLHEHALAHDISLADPFGKFRQRREDFPATAVADPAALWEFQATHPQVVRDVLFSTLARDEYPRLSAFKEYLEVNATGPERELGARLATLLSPFCGDGIYAALFDRPTNVSLSSRVVHFELGLISAANRHLKSLVAALILIFIRHHLITLPREQAKLLLLEELGRLLDDLPGAAGIVKELYSQMRKANVLIISVLQLLAQIADPALRAAILSNSPNLLIFNPSDPADLATLAEATGLSKTAQAEILRYARPSQRTGQMFSEFCYFQRNPLRTICGTARHIQFAPPEEAGPSDKSVTTPNR